MPRVFLTALFSLLLVGMQQQLVVHDVSHLRAQVLRGHDASLQNAGAGGECVECALLAAGSSAAPLADGTYTLSAAASVPVVFHIDAGLALARPAFYQSRAPPIFL